MPNTDTPRAAETLGRPEEVRLEDQSRPFDEEGFERRFYARRADFVRTQYGRNELTIRGDYGSPDQF